MVILIRRYPNQFSSGKWLTAYVIRLHSAGASLRDEEFPVSHLKLLPSPERRASMPANCEAPWRKAGESL
ncbi:protein of unknown function [Methylocella tundrae]|uniref:Uncharacterized protein n=1 Tax=Methylocella tundrae TaxID=227605 RepID=A0A4V6IMT4_METTU|nr:protein of unknown function [Methylocella tundrae]